MKVGIFYFSGTGNTKYIADKIYDYYANENEVIIQSIEETTNIQEYELLIIGGPIYAGNVPEKLIRWVIRNVPFTQNSNAILFSSSAGLANANGANSLAVKLSKKGYQILGLLKYEMPRNYYFKKYKKNTESEVQQMINNVNSIIHLDLEKLTKSFPMTYKEKVLGIDMLAETMSIMTRFMGKSFSATNECMKCRKCIKSCPTKNIQLKESITFKLNCMMCTRCIHSCPSNAIQYKKESIEQYKLQLKLLQ